MSDFTIEDNVYSIPERVNWVQEEDIEDISTKYEEAMARLDTQEIERSQKVKNKLEQLLERTK